MAWEYALIIGIAVGIILGVIVIRLSGSGSQQKVLQKELDDTKAELEQYRAHISEHFKRSSVLLNNMVKEYSELYSHFSTASHQLTPEHESLANPFDFRIVDATEIEPRSLDDNLENNLTDSTLLNEETSTADNSAEPKKTGDNPPRDYSEGASGLLRTERKE